MVNVIILVGLLLMFLLWYDYQGPSKITLKQCTYFGMPCKKAKNLVVQEYDKDGNLYATRGLLLYRLDKGEKTFMRITRVPVAISFYFLNNFSLFRRFTLRQECVELTVSSNGTICAFSSGTIWIKEKHERHFLPSMTMEHFGRKVGRGVMSTGLVSSDNHEFFIGEYFRNPSRNGVKTFRFDKSGMSWKCFYEFQPGQIRHIHALQVDPYTKKLWICTGDEDSEALIGWFDQKTGKIMSIGKGSQAWRTCQLVFTERNVYWGADTGHAEMAGIYKWDRRTEKVEKLTSIQGGVFYCTRLTNGFIIMSTDREGFSNERDYLTRLIIIGNNDRISIIDCGTWKHRNRGFRFNFAKLRLQRNQDSQMLAVSCLNLKEIPDGDLLLFSEDAINHARIKFETTEVNV